jgi:hypothetical protein
MARVKGDDVCGDPRLEPHRTHQCRDVASGVEVPSGSQKAALDEADEFMCGRTVWIDSPGRHVGIFDDQDASRAQQSPVGRKLLTRTSERSNLEACVHKVE